jgi:hypothetical protein
MPIPKRVLQEASRPLAERVLEFLQRDPDSGYSLAEIVAEFEGTDEGLASMMLAFRTQLVEGYAAALDALVRDGKVLQVVHQGNTYYAVAG